MKGGKLVKVKNLFKLLDELKKFVKVVKVISVLKLLVKVVLKVKIVKIFVGCCVKMKSVGEGVVKLKVLSIKGVKEIKFEFKVIKVVKLKFGSKVGMVVLKKVVVKIVVFVKKVVGVIKKVVVYVKKLVMVVVVKKFVIGRKLFIVCKMIILKKVLKLVKSVGVGVKVKVVKLVGWLVKKVKKWDVWLLDDYFIGVYEYYYVGGMVDFLFFKWLMGECDCLLVNECGCDFWNLCFRNVSMVGGGCVLGKWLNVIDG